MKPIIIISSIVLVILIYYFGFFYKATIPPEWRYTECFCGLENGQWKCTLQATLTDLMSATYYDTECQSSTGSCPPGFSSLGNNLCRVNQCQLPLLDYGIISGTGYVGNCQCSPENALSMGLTKEGSSPVTGICVWGYGTVTTTPPTTTSIPLTTTSIPPNHGNGKGFFTLVIEWIISFFKSIIEVFR